MKRLVTLALTLAALLLLAVTACADTLPGTATCTITPTDTQISGDTATVTYSVTVTPPQGKELGVFSVQLQPSDGMTLARTWDDADGNHLIDYVDNLRYNDSTRKGIFATYGYTAKTGYFAAVGTTPERRMSQEATILTIQATMPANKAGTYTLNAEFIAALDGSGDVYTARVVTTPVTVSGGKDAPTPDTTPVITETNADTPAQTPDTPSTDGTTGTAGTPGASGADTAAPGNTTPNDAASADTATAPDGTSGNAPADPADPAAPAGSSAILWILLALAAVAIVLIVVVLKKKKR